MVQKSGYWTINSRFLEILWFGYSFRASPLKHDSDFLKVTSALAARNYAPSQPPRCLHCVCFFSNLVGRPKRMVTWWWFPGWFSLTSVNLDPPTLSTEMKLRVLSFVWTCLNFWGVALDHTESAREVAFIKPVPRRESRKSGNVRKYQLRGRNLTCLEFFTLLLACIACFYQLTSVCFGLWQWSTSRFASRTSSVTSDHQCVYRSWYWSSD